MGIDERRVLIEEGRSLLSTPVFETERVYPLLRRLTQLAKLIVDDYDEQRTCYANPKAKSFLARWERRFGVHQEGWRQTVKGLCAIDTRLPSGAMSEWEAGDWILIRMNRIAAAWDLGDHGEDEGETASD